MDHTITLPSQKKVSFRSPKVKDKRDAIRDFSQEDDYRAKGYNLEEAIAAKCITKVDGNVVNLESDLLSDPFDILDSWDLREQQFFMEVFSNLYYLDEKGRQKAADEAKKILGVSKK